VLNKVCAVVPFRSFSNGKQRLSAAMSNESRSLFVEAMLEDTLRALLRSTRLDRVIVLSNDKEASALARELGAVCVAEPSGTAGLNAVVQATANELSPFYDSLLVVHGDLPLLQTAEVDQLITAHKELKQAPGLSIVPDRHGQGSNCVLVSPPNALRFHYGAGSLPKHLAFAKQHGILSQTVELTGAGLDIDVPDDLAALRAHEYLSLAVRVSAVLE